MMSKFTIVDEEWICYASGGYAYTVSNGKCEFVLWEDKNDTQKICDWLNELQTEKSELSQKNIDLLEDKIRSVKEFEKCIDTLMAKIAEQKIIIEQQSFLESKITTLEKENKRLKSRNNYNLEDCLLEIAELKEENEHLRQSVEYWQKKYEEGTETFQINENDIGGMLNE